MGRVGTGKTTVARQLGIPLDWPVFSSDQIRKTLAGIPFAERTAAERRDEVYSEQMTEQTYKQLVAHGLAAVESHGGAVLDATFSSRAHREFLCKECEHAHVGFQFVELDVDLGEIERRLRARNESTGEISDARLEDLEKLNAAYEPPSELATGLISVSANNGTSDTVKAVLLRLAEKQLR
jgi:predicted kinase